MRKPATVEQLYLDFDGFFASVEQQARPALRGKPVGIIPMMGVTRNTCIIACSKEAKAAGLSNVMSIEDARAKCPDLVLASQSPDLYRRAHATLLSEITAVLPIDAIKSIDELTCRLSPKDISNPYGLAERIKDRIRHSIGEYITCSIGMAANRQLAKIACKVNKPDGITVWTPADLPSALFLRPLEEIPGVGRRMQKRLNAAGIYSTKELWNTSPKHMRKLWRNVNGERLWYALHGYDLKAHAAQRKAYGHGRVLPPSHRGLDAAYDCARLLLVKAARRMRRDGYYAGRLWLWMATQKGSYSNSIILFDAYDDHTCLKGLARVWDQACSTLEKRVVIFRLGVTLMDLSTSEDRQMDWLENENSKRHKWEKVQTAVDSINQRYARTAITHGLWRPPPGGYAGGKISYTRIPKAEDFW